MNTYEEQKAIVAKFNVIADVFFQKLVDDIEPHWGQVLLNFYKLVQLFCKKAIDIHENM
jgi:hypothetical protein